MTWLELVLGFRGRIGRKTFWLASLLPTALYLPSLYEMYRGLKLALSLSTATPQLAELLALRNSGSGTFASILALIALYIMLTLNAKRLHDLGKSGWMQALAFVGLPMALGGMFLMFVPGMALLAWALILGSLVFSLWGLWIVVQIWFFAGNPGGNDYGPHPDGERITSGIAHEIEAMQMANARGSTQSAAAATEPAKRTAKPARPASIQPTGFGRRGPRMA